MKRGFKALAVLAAAVAAIAGPQAFAVCGELGGYAIFQCGDRAYFMPPPAGAGAVTAAYWQIGFGNNTLNTGQGSNGTGNAGPTTFNGNDSGLATVELVPSSVFFPGAPAGSLCLGNNNWGNFNIDGCCDNFRDVSLPGGTGDDGILNPLYNVYYARNGYPFSASNDWVVDSPMAVLLKEGSGNYFAIAAVATTARTAIDDVRVGQYNFKDVTNGMPNAVTGAMNVIPWQKVPGQRFAGDPSSNFVVNASFVPGNTNTNKILDLQWDAVEIYSDQSSRPSTNATVTSGGMGVNEAGSLVRYVVETQAIVDGNNPYGTLNPAGWTAAATTTGNTAQITVGPDTCVRLHTYFGKEPTAATPSTANCRIGTCGDLGFDVVSGPACIGGPLAADGVPSNLIASRKQGSVDLSWKTSPELSVTKYEVYAVGKGGSVKVAETACNECASGVGSSYSLSIPTAKLKGSRTLEVVAVGPGSKAKTTIK